MVLDLHSHHMSPWCSRDSLPFTLISCNMENEMLPEYVGLVREKHIACLSKLSESRGIKRTIIHAVSLRYVHDLSLSDNRCPLLFDVNLHLLTCNPSVPKVISSHRRVTFLQVLLALCHLDFPAYLPCFCLPFLLGVQAFPAFRVGSRHQQNKHMPGTAHFEGRNFSHSNCDVLPHSVRFNRKYSQLFC